MEKIILLIDDDPDDIALVREALLELNDRMIINVAYSGQRAIEMLNDTQMPVPDYIFLDLNMPKMDGRQCLLHLRKNPRLNNTIVFIFSTSRTYNDGKEYKALGADLYFTKPSLYSELKNILAIALSGSRHKFSGLYRY